MNEMLLAEKLATAIDFVNIAPKKLAGEIGVSVQMISKVCKGESFLSLKKFFHLCNKLEVSLGYFDEGVNAKEIAQYKIVRENSRHKDVEKLDAINNINGILCDLSKREVRLIERIVTDLNPYLTK